MATRRTAAAAAITASPESDRTGAFVGELSSLIKASYVVFARYDQSGLQNEMVLAEDRGNAGRTVTASWTNDPKTWEPGTVVPLPFMVVRVAPLAGQGGPKIGVLVERYRSRNPLRHAADKFAMSSRELEVLSLVLKGFGTPQIATALDIAESTAHDHIKRMMLKTRARNRVFSIMRLM